MRDDASIERAVAQTVERFGGIDICVNNASALALQGTEALSMKKFDLMMSIQLRGTFGLTRAALPHLRNSENPHVLTLSPPLNITPKWLGAHPGYTLAKYGMSMLALGWAAEFADAGIASNTLWPESLIATAAVANIIGDDRDAAGAHARDHGRRRDRDRDPSGQARHGQRLHRRRRAARCGVTDLSKYGGGGDLQYDIFIDR